MGGKRTISGGCFAALVATLLSLTVYLAAPAQAAFFAVVQAVFPDLAVGQTFPVTMGLNNSSTPPNNVTIHLANIDLYPACTNALTDCTGGTAEAGVYSLSATGTGTASPAGNATCEGTWTVVPDTGNVSTATRYRFVPPLGEGTLAMAPGEGCAVDLTVTPRRVPTVDVSPSLPGVQTNHVTGASIAESPGPRFGQPEQSTVLQGQPTIVTSATPTAEVGQFMFDSATIGVPDGAAAPTGTVAFTLFGPGDPGCAQLPIFTNVATVLPGPPDMAFSTGFSPSVPGSYNWVASYSGDANYAPAAGVCGDPGETTVVSAPPVASITTQATPVAQLGQPISDAATVSVSPQGAPAPTGTVIFTAYGPNDPTCSGPPAFSSFSPLVPGPPATADSPPFTPPTAGSYNWVATYSGDANYAAVGTACGDPNEISVVPQVQPTIVTQATPTADLGQPISDTATVSGSGFPPTGTVTFQLFGPGDPTCAGAPAFTSTVPVDPGLPATASSAPFTPVAAGSYNWVASYSGDANFLPAATVCNDPNETSVVTDPTLSEIAVFRPSTGFWFFHNGPAVQWGTQGDQPVMADYDGDGEDEIAVWRPSNGIWFVRNGPVVQWGTQGDLAVPADYDGDGDDDIAVYRPSTGQWFVKDGLLVTHGGGGDIPVPADYDGNGTDDITTFNPLLGLWSIRDQALILFGVGGDIPVPADYDGDGDGDIATFRPSSGVWYFHGSPTAVQWGTNGDVPVPADYDDDADAEVAVWRPSNGIWFVRNGPIVQWGTAGDYPIPLPSAVRQLYFP